MPARAAVPETAKGAAMMACTSVMPAVSSAARYISSSHQVTFSADTCVPLPSSSSRIYTQEIEAVPMTLSST